MLSPAVHVLMCRKSRILSTLDRTCHQAPCSVKFLATRSSFAVSQSRPVTRSSCSSGFGEVVICRNNIRRIRSLVPLLRTMLKSYAPKKNGPASDTITASQTNPPRSNTRHPLRNGHPRRQPEQPPGSTTRVYLDFVRMTFLQQGEANWLKFTRQFVALLYLPVSLVSQMPQEAGGQGIILYCCRGCAGGQ